MEDFKKKRDISQAMVKPGSLKDVPSQIEMQGGSRVQLRDHINEPMRAGTLSDLINKIKSKGGTVAKFANNPAVKKGAIALAGPAGLALNAADAMASVDEIGQGSDEVDPFMMEEALLENEPQNFADPEVSEQARRWQKIRGILE